MSVCSLKGLAQADNASLPFMPTCRGEPAHVPMQLVIAVDYCHSLGIVNRDLKLENVLIGKLRRRNPLVKICDFG